MKRTAQMKRNSISGNLRTSVPSAVCFEEAAAENPEATRKGGDADMKVFSRKEQLPGEPQIMRMKRIPQMKRNKIGPLVLFVHLGTNALSGEKERDALFERLGLMPCL
jgi:hypothetical protein